MKLTPIDHYIAPKYPTQQAVLRSPGILYTAPKRWKSKSGVMTALVLTVTTGLTGCGAKAPEASSVPEAESADSTIVSSTISEYVLVGEVPDASVPLASPDGYGKNLGTIPLFIHGEGRGSYGCVSVAPPVFLSEEEAIQVIREEAEAQGVHFSETIDIEGTFPATTWDLDSPFSPTTAPGTWEGKLTLDGYDSNLNLGFEYVSHEDIKNWNSDTGYASTVIQYDYKGTAQRLSDATENVAVFYDPASQDYDAFDQGFDWDDPSANISEYETQYTDEQKEKVIEDLRAQVRDFLEWLKGQGVI